MIKIVNMYDLKKNIFETDYTNQIGKILVFMDIYDRYIHIKIDTGTIYVHLYVIYTDKEDIKFLYQHHVKLAFKIVEERKK